MAEEEIARVSGADIGAVASKLEAMAKSLSPQEQLVVGWLLERAAHAPAEASEEVKGYLFGAQSALISPGIAGPATFQNAFSNSLGLGRSAAATATFSVGVRFQPSSQGRR